MQNAVGWSDPGFDLAAFWQAWCADFETQRAQYPVEIRIAPQLVAQLPYYLGETMQERMTASEMPDAADWVRITVGRSILV